MITTPILVLVGVLHYSATYKCQDAHGNWSAEACQPRAAPTAPVEAQQAHTNDPNERTLLDNTIGCQNKDVLEGFRKYRSDQDALQKYAVLAVASGECTTFNKGEVAYRVDSSFFDEMVKLRRKGDLREYWTIRQATAADK
jgi:hypothetical protein